MSNYTTDDAVNILYRCGITTLPTLLKYLHKGNFTIPERNLERKLTLLNQGQEVCDKRKGASGRPSVVSQRDETRILCLLEKEPCLNAAEIKTNLKLPYNAKTIGRFLKLKGFEYLRISERPRLSAEDREERLKFAKRHRMHSWEETFFLDESTFRLGSHRSRAYQQPNKRLFAPVDKMPAKLNVIGMISFRGGSRLICFEENLDAKLFVSFLKDLKKDADRLYRRRNYRLCMDRDPKHTAKKSLEYMNDAQINYYAD